MIQIHFVESIPKAEDIKDGNLYISVKYNMTMHRCASGCGQLIPLPLSPADWSFTYDGETISLSPSVGNGLLECNSHYNIRKSQIVWLNEMSNEQTLRQNIHDADLQFSHISKQVKSKDRQHLSLLDRIFNIFK